MREMSLNSGCARLAMWARFGWLMTRRLRLAGVEGCSWMGFYGALRTYSVIGQRFRYSNEQLPASLI